MKRNAAILCLLAAGIASTAFAQEGAVPKGVPHLDHVWMIMMENHGFKQLVNNPNAPFINDLAKSSNTGVNYFAVGHPSLTNYLETVGGSNFGIRNDNSPDWHNTTCKPNLGSGTPSLEGAANICPISGTGSDAETPALDCTNETTVAPPCTIARGALIDVDGTLSFPVSQKTVGKTIADQLYERGFTWKSYQENLPPGGADKVNNSDGFSATSPISLRSSPAARFLPGACRG